MKKRIITIAGSPGSGKSSAAKAIAATLGFRHYSSGDLFRQIAFQRNESIEATNIAAEIRRDIDLEVDRMLQEIYRSADTLVVDSRMAWHWMPSSFKVYLLLDMETAAQRIFAHLQGGGRISEEAESVEEVRKSIDRRFESEQKRYRALYGVDFTDPLNFDATFSTAGNNLKVVTAMIVASYEVWISIS
jgi:cytidylate kinase